MKSLSVVLVLLFICHGFAHEQNSKNNAYAILEIEASKCMPQCLECQNGPNSCTKCTQGQNCCNRECSQCQNQKICKACKQDFKLDQKLNICVSEFSCDDLWCDDCDYQNYICTKCYEGYFLNTEMLTCDKCQQECIFCQSLDNCTLCTPGTYLDKGDCLKCKQNCQECKNNVTCDFCAQSYYIDKTGKCTKCIDSCMKCTSAKDCQQCQPKFYYDNDTNKCLSCPPECSQCKNQNQCIKCDPGYFFNKTLKTCQTCQEFYPHCINCHDTQSNLYNASSAISTTICLTCSPRYYVSKNQCISCPQNCIQCQRQNQCQICAQKYFLNQSKLCQQCNIMYCITCQKSDVCRICQQKYYWNPDMSRSQCLRCPYGCNQCDKFTCTICLMGFYLKNGNCYRCDSACYSCSSGPVDCNICMPGFFKIQYDKGRCIKCAQPCLECKNITSCTKCVPGFYLQNNICKKCQIEGCDQCQLSEVTVDVTNDYNNSNLMIQITQKLITKSCLRCSQSYTIINSTCKQCMPGCQRCLDITFCNACYRGYSRNSQGTKCTKCPQHCISCEISPTNSSQIKIHQCQAGYTSDSSYKKCIPCMKNCKLCTQSSDSYCIDCFQGYYRLISDQPSHQCLPCQPPCKLCQSLTQCLSCVMGYYMNPHDQCIKCQQGCQQCNQQGCFVCQQGYRLNTIKLQCEKCTIKSCIHCKQSINKCDTCQQGYAHYNITTNSAQICYRCDQSIQGCKQCSSPYTCTQCFNGLILSESGSVNDDGLITTNSCVANNNDNDNDGNFTQQIIFYAIISLLAVICLILTVIIFKIKRQNILSPNKINKKVIKPNQTQTLMQTSQQSISPIDIVISSNKNTQQNKKSSVFNSFTGIN